MVSDHLNGSRLGDVWYWVKPELTMMAVSVPIWLGRLAKIFNRSGYQLFLVGGAVREELLGRNVREWDLATDAKPTEVEAILRPLTKNLGLIGKRFGTVTAVLDGNQVEITTFRGESYEEESRLPEVVFGKSIEEDLSRRDFTINAIAYDLISPRLLDPHHGQDDLDKKIIRAVGDAESRFREDPLRMLRAIRFAVTLDFTIEPDTFKAIKLERERFGILSAERVAQEMDKILMIYPEQSRGTSLPSRGIDLLAESGLINYILPELIPCIDLEFDPTEHKDIYGHILQVLDQTPAKLELRWCALLHDIAKPLTRQKIGGEYHFLGHEVVGARLAKDILRRLKYGNEFVDYLSKLVYLHQRIPNNDGAWTDGAVRRFVRDAGDTLGDLFAFAAADSTGANTRKLERYQQMRATLQERIEKLEKQAEIAKIKSPLSGEELMALYNKPPGAWIKPIKQHLLDLVLDDKLAPDDKAEAEKIAKNLIKD